LRASGETNISEGLEAARVCLARGTSSTRSAILLLSDGQPTRGLISPDGLAAQARSMRNETSISTLGYGRGHDDRVLNAVSDAAGGTYQFIQDPIVCHFKLAKAVGAQSDVVAERIDLVLRPERGVRIEKVLLEPMGHIGADGLAIAVPDLAEEEERIIAVELAITAPDECGSMPAVELVLRHHAAGQKLEQKIRASIAVAVRPATAEIDEAPLG